MAQVPAIITLLQSLSFGKCLPEQHWATGCTISLPIWFQYLKQEWRPEEHNKNKKFWRITTCICPKPIDLGKCPGVGEHKPRIDLNGIYQSCSNVRQVVITLHANDGNAERIEKPFLLEWKVFTCAFWRTWPLPVSGVVMQEDTNGVDKWGSIQPSWISLCLYFQPHPIPGPCIRSSLCLKCSILRSSHGWPLCFKDLTKCHSLW